MNVTLKLPDDLVRKARHLAIDENTSLSVLISELLDAKLKAQKHSDPKAPSLAESLLMPEEPEWFSQTEYPLLNRDVMPLRATPFHFEPDSKS